MQLGDITVVRAVRLVLFLEGKTVDIGILDTARVARRPRMSGSLTRVCSLLVLLLLLTACGAADESVPQAGENDGAAADAADDDESLPVVRMQALSGGMGAVGLKIIEENGFDQDNGFQGEYFYLDSAGSTQQWLQGRSDVAFDTDPLEVAVARSEGHMVTTFYSYQPNNSCLVVRNDSPYEDPSDLVGEKVGYTGVDSGTTQNLAAILSAFYDVNLLDEFELVENAPAGVVELLKNDEVEAITAFEPHLSRAIVEADARCLVGPVIDEWQEREDGNVFIGSLGAYDEWLEENPRLAKKVIDAWEDALAWINEDPSRLVNEPYTSLVGIDDPAVLELIEARITEVPIYIGEWGEDERAATDILLQYVADSETGLIREVPEGVVTILDE